MPSKYWGEAVTTAVYLLNRSPTKSVQDKTQYEALAWQETMSRSFENLWLSCSCKEDWAWCWEAVRQIHNNCSVRL